MKGLQQLELPLKKRARGTLVILNDRGLHTRPSTELVRCATGFRSTISLSVGQMIVNAKSVLGVMTLAASKGTQIQVEIEGPDAQEALDALLTLASQRFNIHY